MLTSVFVLVRILANPVSNVFQKQLPEQSVRPIVIIGVVHACLTVVCAPLLLGVVGVLLIVAGSYLVVDRRVDEPGRNAFVLFFRERGVPLRFAALILAATEAVFLKRAILLSSPWTVFVLWSLLGVPLAAIAFRFQDAHVADRIK